MRGVSITFDPQIASYAAAHKLQLSREESEHLAATLNAICTIDDASQVSFDLGGGRVGSITDAMDVFAVGMGKPVSATPAKPSILAGSNATARALATNAALRAGSAAAKQQQAETLARTFGNPWREGQINRTHAAFISNTNPELAARLKAEAGAKS